MVDKRILWKAIKQYVVAHKITIAQISGAFLFGGVIGYTQLGERLAVYLACRWGLMDPETCKYLATILILPMKFEYTEDNNEQILDDNKNETIQ